MTILSISLLTLLASGWVYAWLLWCFSGDARRIFLSTKMAPKSIREISTKELWSLTEEEFDIHVASMPSMFWATLLSCPTCLSAWLAGASSIVIALYILVTLPFLSILLLPLIWGASAAVGLHLYNKNYGNAKN